MALRTYKDTLVASISEAWLWMSKDWGCNMQTKNMSDFWKKDLWLCLIPKRQEEIKVSNRPYIAAAFT